MCCAVVSRRDFLKTTGFLGSLVALSNILPTETLLKEVSKQEAEQLKAEANEVKTTLVSLSLCGFAGAQQISAVDVKNSKIIRIRPLHFDWQYKPEDFNYNVAKIEVNGKVFEAPLKSLLGYLAQGYKKRVYSPNRVRYPLKRVDWSPDNPNPQNRGKSGFVRITWDEAINTLVNMIKKISEKYGPSAILTQSEGHSQSKSLHGGAHFWVDHLSKFTGFTRQTRNPDSWEGWWWGAKHVWGMEGGIGLCDYQQNNLLETLENSELLLFWGADLETTPHGFSGQFSSVYHFWWREAGKKCIYICPDGNYAAVVHADKWIPVLPNTDIALHLAIAYVWITEGTYDKQYVDTHTYGFDKFKAYVLGEEDGIPKTPKWAEQICGVPARTIKALARAWAKKKTSIVHHFGGAMVRGPYCSEPGRTEVYLLAMQGIGKPGVQQVQAWGNWGGLGTTAPLAFSPIVVPSTGAVTPYMAGASFMVIDPPFIVKTLVPDAVLRPPIEWYGRCASIATPVEHQFIKTRFPQEGYSEIHAMWKESPCWTACWNGGWAYIEAFRSPKIEFIVHQHPWLENDCLFSDLILPTTTVVEDDIDLLSPGLNEQFAVLYLHLRSIEPIGESKSDLEIVEMVADKLGIRDKVIPWTSHEEAVRKGFEMSGAADFISWDEFRKKQYWVAPVNPKWKEIKPGMRWYWEQPEGKGLKTKSGKIEFYCQWLAENLPDDPERPPVAHYIPYGEMYQESKFHPRAEKYPFLIITNHPRWRMHAQGDDITWLREIETCKIRGPDGYLYEPVWIHPADAAKKGIKHGDIIAVYNDIGMVLGAAYVTERIKPGSVYMDHGARLDLISIDPLIDRGGSTNLICPRSKKMGTPTVAEMVVSGFLVDVKKVDLEEFKAKYPDAFKRKLHPDAGLTYDSWVVG